MRIALFGGTFDPPHRGHLAIAAAAADAFALDQVLFAPTGRQPLKLDAPQPFVTRLALVAAACTQDPRFIPSALDAPHKNSTPNYTIDLLQALRAQHPTATLYNLAGADSFHTLAHWHAAQALLDYQWIVVSRPGYPLADPAGLTLTSAQRTRIHPLDTVHEDISATTLRERLQTSDPCPDLLPPPSANTSQNTTSTAPRNPRPERCQPNHRVPVSPRAPLLTILRVRGNPPHNFPSQPVSLPKRT